MRATSAAFTERCSLGRFRRYSHAPMPNRTVQTPMMTNETRQDPVVPISHATTSPPTAAPSGAPESMRVTPLARFRGGIHFDTSVEAAGMKGASNAPSPTRESTSITAFAANPASAMNEPQTTEATPITVRGPNRSTVRPPGICSRQYDQKNELRMMPWTVPERGSRRR